MIIAMGLGLFSPPIGLGLFATCAITGTKMKDVARPMLKYLARAVHGADAAGVRAGVLSVASTPLWPGLTLACLVGQRVNFHAVARESLRDPMGVLLYFTHIGEGGQPN